MKNPKRISAFIAALLCISMLGGCGNKADDAGSSETSEATAVVTTAVSVDENAVDPSVPFDLEGGVTDKMYNRALLNEGNTSRLAAAMEKAKKGESITVATIGGSITQGTAASNQNNCYAARSTLSTQASAERTPTSAFTALTNSFFPMIPMLLLSNSR